MNKPLVILTGPTAVGKTKISIELAKKINGEIISADSMQIYKYMNIGSAKISKEEMQGIPHYLIDELCPRDEFNVAKFKEMALAAMDIIYNKGKVPIIVGGTGFYIQAILYDIDFSKGSEDTKYRRDLEELLTAKGKEALHNMLGEIDPVAAREIHPNNTKRVIRALEYWNSSGEKISDHNEKERKKDSPYNFVYFVLNDERERLYERINRRVDEMISQGLVNEVKGLKDMGLSRGLVSMQGLGYKEVLDYLDGKYSYDEMVYTIKRDTRHFAKRQLTWFRRERDVTWIDKEKYAYNTDSIVQEMCNILSVKDIYY